MNNWTASFVGDSSGVRQFVTVRLGLWDDERDGSSGSGEREKEDSGIWDAFVLIKWFTLHLGKWDAFDLKMEGVHFSLETSGSNPHKAQTTTGQNENFRFVFELFSTITNVTRIWNKTPFTKQAPRIWIQCDTHEQWSVGGLFQEYLWTFSPRHQIATQCWLQVQPIFT